MAPGFQVTGQGKLVDLNDESINFQLSTSVDHSTATTESEEYNIGGYTLPILCTGDINSPRCLPDTDKILAAIAQRTVTRGLTELLQQAIDKRSKNENNTPANNLDGSESDTTSDTTEEEPEDLGTELLDRALDSLFN